MEPKHQQNAMDPALQPTVDLNHHDDNDTATTLANPALSVGKILSFSDHQTNKTVHVKIVPPLPPTAPASVASAPLAADIASVALDQHHPENSKKQVVNVNSTKIVIKNLPSAGRERTGGTPPLLVATTANATKTPKTVRPSKSVVASRAAEPQPTNSSGASDQQYARGTEAPMKISGTRSHAPEMMSMDMEIEAPADDDAPEAMDDSGDLAGEVFHQQQPQSQQRNTSTPKYNREFKELQKTFSSSKVLSNMVQMGDSPSGVRKARKSPPVQGKSAASPAEQSITTTSSENSSNSITITSKTTTSSTDATASTPNTTSTTTTTTTTVSTTTPHAEKRRRSRASVSASDKLEESSITSVSPFADKSGRTMRSQNAEFSAKHQSFLMGIHRDSLYSDDDSTSGTVVLLGQPDGGDAAADTSVEAGAAAAADEGANAVSLRAAAAAESRLRPGSDSFCWLCHQPGAQMPCIDCLRSRHIDERDCSRVRLIPASDRWRCAECVNELDAKRSARPVKYTLTQLGPMLRFAIERLKQIIGPRQYPPVALNSIVLSEQHSMTFEKLRANVDNRRYTSTGAFTADVKWMLHNCIVVGYKANSRPVTMMRQLLKTCKQEMYDIETCPECYYNANTHKENWFVEVCGQRPHILLWAKLKGFPYWPAKSMGLNANASAVDVRFFGEHDRAWVPIKDCFLFSDKDPNPPTKKLSRSNPIADVLNEVHVYIGKLRQKFGKFQYAPLRCAYEPDREDEQLELMIPSIREHLAAQRARSPRSDLTYRIVKTNNSMSIIKSSADAPTDAGPGKEKGKKAASTNAVTGNATAPISAEIPASAQQKTAVAVRPDTRKPTLKRKVKPAQPSTAPPKRRGTLNERMLVSMVTATKVTALNRRHRSVSMLQTRSVSALLTRNSLPGSRSNVASKPGNGMDMDGDVAPEEPAVVDAPVASEQPPPLLASPIKPIDSKTVDTNTENTNNITNTNATIASVSTPQPTPPVSSISRDNTPAERDLAPIVVKQELLDSTDESMQPPVGSVRSSMTSSQSVLKSEPYSSATDDHDQDSWYYDDAIIELSGSTTISSTSQKATLEDQPLQQQQQQQQPQQQQQQLLRGYISVKDLSELKNPLMEGERRVGESTTLRCIHKRDKTERKYITASRSGRPPGPQSSKFPPHLHIPTGNQQMPQQDQMPNQPQHPQQHSSHMVCIPMHDSNQFRTIGGSNSTNIGIAASQTNDFLQLLPNNKSLPPPLTSVSHGPATLQSVPTTTLAAASTPNTHTTMSQLPQAQQQQVQQQPPKSLCYFAPSASASATASTSSCPPPLTLSMHSMPPALMPPLRATTVTPAIIAATAAKVATPSGATANTVAASPPLSAAPTVSKVIPSINNSGSTTPAAATAPATVVHMPGGFVPDNPAAPGTDSIARGTLYPMPRLHAKPSGALRSDGTGPATPAEAGPVSRMLLNNAHKMSDFFRSVLEDTLSDMCPANAEPDQQCLEARNTLLQLEIERLRHAHAAELAQVNANTDRILAEMQRTMKTERQRITSECRRQAEIDRIRIIEETKRKQWCVNCSREAQFFCCWNTSYCDYPCQEQHWVRHMPNCAQAAAKGSSAGAVSAPVPMMATAPATVAMQLQNGGPSEKNAQPHLQKQQPSLPQELKIVRLNATTTTTPAETANVITVGTTGQVRQLQQHQQLQQHHKQMMLNYMEGGVQRNHQQSSVRAPRINNTNSNIRSSSNAPTQSTRTTAASSHFSLLNNRQVNCVMVTQSANATGTINLNHHTNTNQNIVTSAKMANSILLGPGGSSGGGGSLSTATPHVRHVQQQQQKR